ncbi:Protein MEI2-like 6 [Linum grandiflorum]
MASETNSSHSLNPNAAPFIGGGRPPLQQNNMTSRPLHLPYYYIYSRSSPKSLLPPPISSSDVAPVTFCTANATVLHPFYYLHHQSYYHCIYYFNHHQTSFYATTGNTSYGGFHLIPHAAPYSQTATPAEPVPTASYRVVESQPVMGSSSELKRSMVVTKSRKMTIKKKNKFVPRRGGSRRSSALIKASSAMTKKMEKNGGDDEKKEEGATSLMIRNIPNHLQRIQMLGYLDRHCANENSSADGGCVLSEYDFFYLPIDFSTGANLGYAFVNFTTAVAASRFQQAFDGYAWKVRNSGKICQITAAAIQGKEALVANFSSSVFRCERAHYLPLEFDPPRGGRCLKSFGKVVGKHLAPDLPWAAKPLRLTHGN